MKIGYARVSTDEQNLDLQRTALKAAGCERVFEDRGISGVESTRPGLAATLAALGPGEAVIPPALGATLSFVFLYGTLKR